MVSGLYVWIFIAFAPDNFAEFIISLAIVGNYKDARKLLSDVLNISDQNGIPYMGWQYEENIFWPEEKPSWTSAALIIAADTVFDYSDASDLFIKDQSILPDKLILQFEALAQNIVLVYLDAPPMTFHSKFLFKS